MRNARQLKSPFEKPKNFKTSILELIRYCKKFLPVIIVSIFLAIVGAILSVIGPNKLSDLANLIIDNMFTGINLKAVAEIGLTLVTIYSLSLIFNTIQGVMMADVSQKISKQLRYDINRKITLLPFSYIDENPHGNVMSKMANCVDTIGQGLNHSVAAFIGAIALLVSAVIMMFITNWIMAITAILSTMVGFILIAAIMKKSQKYFSIQQEVLGDVNGLIEETFTAHDIIKLYNATKNKQKQFEKVNIKLYQSTWKSQFLSGIMPTLMGFIGNFGYVSVCIVGAILVSQNIITIGTIVAFMLYVRLFSNPLTQIAQSLSYLQLTAAAGERVFELLNEEEMLPDKKIIKINPKKITGNVEFENIKFGYTKNKTIINNFSAKIKAGQKVAIVGPTGAGKTTLVNLLMRFYELDEGNIKIDKTDIKRISRHNLHNIFGMVLQDTWLFEGTIKENLVFNQKNVKKKTLDEVIESSGLTHFIKTLPNGYDTKLDDNTAISIGQKQLLTIARAMIQNRPMLILDEATSSVDTRTEISIQKAMDKLTHKRTSFVIAHRLSTIKNADLILVMNDGDIVEQGKHKELLNKNGFYANLYNSQFED